jgi:adenine-specific DNA glycosylase
VLVVKRRAGLLAGTWSLPEAVDRGARARPGIARKLAEATGVRVAGVAYRGAVRHVFTHRDVTAELFRVEVDASGPAAPDRRWVSPAAIGAIGVSSFARKTVEMGLRRSIGRSEM